MEFHFTPEKGWINDPNGLVKIEDTYHIFYQYYPDDIKWGPMHWGHAISKDLLHFEHKSIALCPDELGYIFSGSCVLDKDNVSGLGVDERPALLAFYTSHNPETGEQQQSVAYSLDYENFVKYEDNPVISNRKGTPGYQVDFRDPKVFENPVTGGYSMVLAAGHHIEFFHSRNLLEWEKTGEFDPGVNGFAGICECPDCIFLPVTNAHNEGAGKWVLLISSILDEDKVGKPLSEQGYPNAHCMQYFVGEFDGESFVDTEKNLEPLVLDYGTDNYAMVSFSNCRDVILYGWGEHWDYVTETPADISRGKMTVARTVALKLTDKGYRLSMRPLENVPQRNYVIAEGENLCLVNTKGHELIVSVGSDFIEVDRRETVLDIKSECLKKKEYNLFSAKRYFSGECEICVVQDGDYFEIFAEDSLVSFSVMTY